MIIFNQSEGLTLLTCISKILVPGATPSGTVAE